MPVRPGDLTFDHISRLADDVVTVSDDAIVEAVLLDVQSREDGGRTERCRQPCRGPDAALPKEAAGLKAPSSPIISGGNVSADTLVEWVAKR